MKTKEIVLLSGLALVAIKLFKRKSDKSENGIGAVENEKSLNEYLGSYEGFIKIALEDPTYKGFFKMYVPEKKRIQVERKIGFII